jgi:hypothetical protein
VTKDNPVPSVLNQLENNDAVLLMYLADELAAEDRAEVERMLAVDADLRGQLERLGAAHDSVSAALAQDDRAARLAVSEAAAVRRLGRAMRQWNARRLAAAPVPVRQTSSLRYPWWTYPLAAAASVVIAFLVWWGNTDSTIVTRNERVVHSMPGDDWYGGADSAMAAADPDEMLAWSLGLGDPGADGFGGPYGSGFGSGGFGSPYGGAGPGEWDGPGSLYAAVAPTDANVLMLLNNNADDDPAPDDEAIYQ